MKRLLFLFMAVFCMSGLYGQASFNSGNGNIFYGGSMGFSFGSYTRVSIMPLVGYRLTPEFSLGLRGNYEYIRDNRFSRPLKASNYGGSVLGRYRFIENAYAQAEFAYYNYKFWVTDTESTREWVPFLFLGGGYIQPISGRTAFFAEILFDVIQDPNSPYRNWQPLINFGVGVGF